MIRIVFLCMGCVSLIISMFQLAFQYHSYIISRVVFNLLVITAIVHLLFDSDSFFIICGISVANTGIIFMMMELGVDVNQAVLLLRLLSLYWLIVVIHSFLVGLCKEIK